MVIRRKSSKGDGGPATRQRILDSARELFALRGFERVTMRDIAHAIRYTPATIYLHFRDKAALLRELVEQDFLALSARFHKLSRLEDPVERLREMGYMYVEFGLAYPNHYRLLFMTAHTESMAKAGNGPLTLGAGSPERDVYAFLMATVEECLATGKFRPEYGNVEQVSQMLWAAMHGVVALSITKGDDPWITWKSPTRTVALLIDTLLRGALASPEE